MGLMAIIKPRFKQLIDKISTLSYGLKMSNNTTTTKTYDFIVPQDGTYFFQIKGNGATTRPTIDRQSANLLEFAAGETTVNGVTITKLSDGTMVLNGTCTSTIYPMLGYVENIDTEKYYTLQDCNPDWQGPEPNVGSHAWIYVSSCDANNTELQNSTLKTSSVSSETKKPYTGSVKFSVRFGLRGGVTFNNYVLKPMLVCENIIRYPYIDSNGSSNGITRTVNADGSITLSGTASANSYFYLENDTLPLIDGHIYRMGCVISGTTSGMYPSFQLRDTGSSTVLTRVNANATTREVTYTVSGTGNRRLLLSIASGLTVDCTCHCYMYDETLGFGNRSFFKGGLSTGFTPSSTAVDSNRRLSWWFKDLRRGDKIIYQIPAGTSAEAHVGCSTSFLGLGTSVSRLLDTQYADSVDKATETRTYTVPSNASKVLCQYAAWNSGGTITVQGKKNNSVLTPLSEDSTTSSNVKYGVYLEDAKQGDTFEIKNTFSATPGMGSFATNYYALSSIPEKWYKYITKSTSSIDPELYIEEVINGFQVLRTYVITKSQATSSPVKFGNVQVVYNTSTSAWDIYSTKLWASSISGPLSDPGLAVSVASGTATNSQIRTEL